MSNEYYCNVCDYNTSKKYNYNRHLLNDKHHKRLEAKKNEEFEQRHHCTCGKKYKHRPNLYNHRRKCNVYNEGIYLNNSNVINVKNNFKRNNKENVTIEINSDINVENKDKLYYTSSDNNLINNKSISIECENIIDTSENIIDFDIKNKNYNEIIEYLIHQNNDLKLMLFEQQKQITELIPKIGNTTNNTNNFNISIFLNEKCKNAVSITEFINNIDVTIKDLIHTKEKGLADGISNIFIENMNKLSIYQRPIHCTDLKREILYIKNDTWEKDENKEKIRNALQIINNKQVKSISKINKPNKIYLLNDKEKDEYFAIIKNVTNPLDPNENKIIKKICKNTYINSTNSIDLIKNNS
jgi:hypothetical protein